LPVGGLLASSKSLCISFFWGMHFQVRLAFNVIQLVI
jgi:hypothetical protein